MKKPQQQDPVRRPGIEVGDHVYFQHSAGPRCGRVRAHGKHGCTIECDGEHHKVHWDKVLGHKKRAAKRFSIIDEGEDGMIVEDAAGQRRFLTVPPEASEDKLVTKSFVADGRIVLLTKAEPPASGPMSSRPGLQKKQIVDRTGRKQTKWVRAQQDQPKERPHGHAEAGADAGYGTHNLQAGDKVNFKAGDFEGAGEIVGQPGNDGAHVKDASGRVHQVKWAEITGHDDKGGADKPKVKNEVRGEQKPIPADQFDAMAYAKSHEDASVTPDAIIGQFPPDTKEKISAVQERLKSVEQTIDQHKQGERYSEDRAKIHDEIFNHFLSEERIAAATPADGESPTFTMLGGRGGSGKSWFKGKVYDPDKAIVLDADEIKGMLPEYEGWNAHQVHEESSDILENLIQTGRDLGLNMVLDATMKTSKSAIQKINQFKDAGYQIEAHYMHLPRQEAAKRAVARFLGKTNRYVPVEVVLSNTTNEATFDEVRKHADKWSFHDNNVEQGQEPIKISEGGAGMSQKSDIEGPGQLQKSLSMPILMLWRKK